MLIGTFLMKTHLQTVSHQFTNVYTNGLMTTFKTLNSQQTLSTADYSADFLLRQTDSKHRESWLTQKSHKWKVSFSYLMYRSKPHCCWNFSRLCCKLSTLLTTDSHLAVFQPACSGTTEAESQVAKAQSSSQQSNGQLVFLNLRNKNLTEGHFSSYCSSFCSQFKSALCNCWFFGNFWHALLKSHWSSNA